MLINTLKEMQKISSEITTNNTATTTKMQGSIKKLIVDFAPYSGFSATEFDQKRKNDFLAQGIYIRCVDGDKLNKKGALRLDKTVLQIIAKIRKFVVENNKLTATTKWQDIKKAIAPKISAKIKALDSAYRKLSDADKEFIFKALAERNKAKAIKITGENKQKKVA